MTLSVILKHTNEKTILKDIKQTNGENFYLDSLNSKIKK